MPETTDEIPITHLQRRRIEGRVLLFEACREQFGDGATRQLVFTTIARLAVEDGARWANAHGCGLASLKTVVQQIWAGGGSLDVEIVSARDDHLDVNVTRCRYAEFYKNLGAPIWVI
jgi:hypothetical protein